MSNRNPRAFLPGRSQLSLLFHPFVEEKEEYFEVMRATLEELHQLVYNGVVWCVPCRDVAQWMRIQAAR